MTKGRDINSLGPGFAAHGGAVPISIEVRSSCSSLWVNVLTRFLTECRRDW